MSTEGLREIPATGKLRRDGRLAWTVDEFRAEVPIGRTKLYAEIKAGAIEARKLGRHTLIITSPAEYLKSLPKAGEGC